MDSKGSGNKNLGRSGENPKNLRRKDMVNSRFRFHLSHPNFKKNGGHKYVCKKTLLIPFAIALAFVLTATAANAPKLTFKFTKVTIPGATSTSPGGISNAGVIIGIYVDTSGAVHGFILNGKKVTTLTHPASSNTGAYHIAANGKVRVVGAYYPNSGGVMGFLYEGGKYTDIPGPKGSIGSVAQGINDNGDIVGQFADTKGTHGFLLSKGKYTTLDVPGNFGGTVATGINDKGFVVVYWGDTKFSIESSIYNPKTKKFKKINVPGASLTAAWDINNAGDVVYEWIDSAGAEHGALLHGGHYYKFDYPKSAGTQAVGINDKGMIVGGYSNGVSFLGYKASY